MYISTCNWQSANAAFMGVSCCDMSWYVRLSIAWWKRITYKTYWPVIYFKLIPVLLIKNDQNQSHFALPLISWHILISCYESSKYDNTWKRNQRSNFSSTFTKKGGTNRDTATINAVRFCAWEYKSWLCEFNTTMEVKSFRTFPVILDWNWRPSPPPSSQTYDVQ